MSFWGAKVIISLFGAVPVIGNDLVQWIMGDYLPGDATINRFFALHVIALPLALLLIVTLHILALHEKGSNNPDGVEISDTPSPSGHPLDGIPFHPYYTVDDILSTSVLLLIAAFVIFYAPTFGGWFLEHDNFVPANNLATPEHIKPVWYFTPFYAMLRAIPNKLLGVVVLVAAVLILFFMPWIDRGDVRSIRYRGLGYKIALACFAIAFVGLGAIGAGVSAELIPRWFGPGADVTMIENAFGRSMTAVYFGFFLFTFVYTRFGFERTRAVPKRVTYDVD
jgi:ubiquinol-cytochrome c reductase cytochrome b subunit